jgi:hypothetical protein
MVGPQVFWGQICIRKVPHCSINILCSLLHNLGTFVRSVFREAFTVRFHILTPIQLHTYEVLQLALCISHSLQVEKIPKRFPTLSVVEQLHSDVPAFCNSIPNLLYCALISIRSLQKPDAESHHGHDANQSQAIIIFRPNNLFQHEAVFSESILPGQGNFFNNNQFQSLKQLF